MNQYLVDTFPMKSQTVTDMELGYDYIDHLNILTFEENFQTTFDFSLIVHYFVHI